MTNHKHLKQLIRARMEKTGERYAAARRHIVAARGSSPSADYPFHFPGSIPAVTAMRSLLAAAGLKDPATGEPFAEEILFGLAGGIGIGVFTFLYDKDDFASFFVGGRHIWQDDEVYLKAAFKRLGVGVKIWETGGAKAAAKSLDEALAGKGPVIAWVDAGMLPHRAVPEAMQGGGYHVVTVHTFADNGRRVVIGDLADDPIEIDAEAFSAARARIKKFRNRLMTVSMAPGRVDLDVAVADALKACHAVLAGKGAIGARKNFSLDALSEWADQLTGAGKKSWQHVFPPGKRMWSALTMLYEFVELHGTGGGLCRPIFADSLTTLGERLQRPKLTELGRGYGNAGRGWGDLASTALPSNVAILGEARDCMTKRAELRASDAGNVDDINRLSSELDRLEQAASRDFPLTDRQCTALRDDLRARVLALHAAESELHAAMERGV